MTQVSPHKKSIWSIILLAVIFFLALVALMELVARTSWFGQVSPYRSVGNYHYQFEIKWFRLQDYVKQNGGVDIIVLGSSLVNTSIDPDIVSQTYHEQTGVSPRIFNFGVEGMTVAPNSVIASLLVERYHPALLIYTTEMRDYITGNGLDYEMRFLSDPWFRYQRGDFSLFGWLVDHSAVLQHYLPYRNWMRSDYSETMALYIKRYQDTSASGYEPDSMIGVNVDVPPDPNDSEEAQYFNAYGNYQIATSRLDNLKSILDFNQNQGTTVLVVEMPVHQTFYAYVGGEEVHIQFQQTISSLIAANGGTFLPAEACINTIPLSGRSNRWHLNYLGTPVFSKCLGEQLVVLADQQNIDFNSSNTGGSR